MSHGDKQHARRLRRIPRKIANSKQWEFIEGIKIGPCRVCGDPTNNGRVYGKIKLYSVVPAEHGGDDVSDNVIPLCPDCYTAVTKREPIHVRILVLALTDAEYAYAVEKVGEDVWERIYGIRYER